jgi:hypothetical protein
MKTKVILTDKRLPAKVKTNFTVQVRRYWTDNLGNIIADPYSNTKFPFFLFSRFDMQSGYKQGNSILAPTNGMKFFQQYNPYNGFDYYRAIAFPVTNLFLPGDFILVFVDNPQTPTYYSFIIIRAVAQGYASLLESIENDVDVIEILYHSDNVNQYNEPLYMFNSNKIGLFKTNTIFPLASKTISTVLTDFIRVPLQFSINHLLGLYSIIDHNTNILDFNFIINI